MTSDPSMPLDGPGAPPANASEAYRATMERLYALSRSGTQFGLQRISRVLADLGHPELSFPTAHVAGSNGKGSTSAFLASILSVKRERVGLFTSPHLISLTERIQFVRETVPEEISQDELIKVIAQVEEVSPGFRDLSFFEVVTAAGLLAMRERRVDVGVVEAGLGARLDATRLVDAKVAVLTDLSLEHTAILGDTIEEIAREEGAVVRPGRPLVMADGPPAAMREVETMARRIAAPIHRIGDDLDVKRVGPRRFSLDLGEGRVIEEVELSLLGPHQGRNALLAAKAALLLAPDLEDSDIRQGLLRARWPGRMEVFEGTPPIVLDGAHNPHGAEVLRAALASEPCFQDRPMHFVFGVLADKDVRTMMETLGPIARSTILTRPSSARARSPKELVTISKALGLSSPTVIERLPDALEEAARRARKDEGWVVVCGSLYLVGDVRALLLQRS